MVKGLEIFKRQFKDFKDEYVIIGGTACEILMNDKGLDFRATKDLDIVLIAEMKKPSFYKRLWTFIKEGGYEHCNRSSGEPEYYRFSNPSSSEYPAMIELFSRREKDFAISHSSNKTRLHIDEDISSLSAILLDGEYYQFLKGGITIVSDIPILDASHLIPFKIKAFLDLTSRKNNGGTIDSKNINKHKNDVFRLSELLYGNEKINVSKAILKDVISFVELMRQEDVNLVQLGIKRRGKEAILNELLAIYIEE